MSWKGFSVTICVRNPRGIRFRSHPSGSVSRAREQPGQCSEAGNHAGRFTCWKACEENVMAKLTEAKKKSEPAQEFGLPEQRKYPMPDASHARNAKARASQMEHQGKLSAADKKKIDAKADRILKK